MKEVTGGLYQRGQAGRSQDEHALQRPRGRALAGAGRHGHAPPALHAGHGRQDNDVPQAPRAGGARWLRAHRPRARVADARVSARALQAHPQGARPGHEHEQGPLRGRLSPREALCDQLEPNVDDAAQQAPHGRWHAIRAPRRRRALPLWLALLYGPGHAIRARLDGPAADHARDHDRVLPDPCALHEPAHHAHGQRTPLRRATELPERIPRDCVGPCTCRGGVVHPFVGLKTGFATLFNLHKALVDGCCVLHLAGHGLPGQLFFEGEASQPLMGTAVDAEALDQCLQLAPPCAVSGVQLALLLVCHSASMAGPFVRYGIPHVIAVDAQSKLQDWVAPVFAQRLYMELGTGQSVQTAFDRAIAAVRSHDLSGAEAESEKIQLLPPNDDHRHVLFPPLRGRVATREPFLKRFPSPFLHLHAAETLEFRQKEAVVVSTYLARPPHHPFFTRLVVLTGPEGVGKTHLARAVGDDLALRGYFDGGVHVIYVQAFADTLDATALGPDGCYDAVQAEVSARLKAFAGARKQQCLVLLDGCDVLMQRHQDAGRFFDSILSSQTDWKLLVTTSVAKTPLELGFSAQSYALQPFPYEAGAQLFAKLLARARYPLSVYHLLETPGFDLEVHADVDLWRVLSTHPISQHVLRGLPGTIARVVDEVVATQTTVDAWYKRSFAPQVVRQPILSCPSD